MPCLPLIVRGLRRTNCSFQQLAFLFRMACPSLPSPAAPCPSQYFPLAVCCPEIPTKFRLMVSDQLGSQCNPDERDPATWDASKAPANRLPATQALRCSLWHPQRWSTAVGLPALTRIMVKMGLRWRALLVLVLLCDVKAPGPAFFFFCTPQMLDIRLGS